MSKKEVVVTQAAIPAVYDGPTGMAANIGTSDLRLPRVALQQALSPSVVDGTHKVGALVNSLTQEEIKAPAVITPCFVFKNVIKWKPREQGGGMLYKTTNITADVQKDLAWVGDQKPTADAYINVVCLIDGQEGMPVLLSFCKTSYKAGQDLATLVQLSGCAWKFKYEIGTKLIKGAKGSYYIFTVKRAAKTTEEEAVAAKELYENVKGLSIETDFEGDTTATEQAPIEDTDGL
jgi:hypothetical protein